MTAMRHAPESWDRRPADRLLEDKAWEHLGLTGEEFKRRWYAGEFIGDGRPPVRMLDRYMRTGLWTPIAPTE